MLEVLDTAGQEEYTALRDQWIRDGEGFVLVYSITSRASFSRIQKFYDQIQRVKDSSAPPTPTLPFSNASSSSSSQGPPPVMLVANKIDRVTEREVSTQEGSALAKQMGCDFVEASAKSCINVEKAFYDVIRHLRHQRHRPSRSERKHHSHSKKHSNYDDGSKSKREKARNASRQCVIL